MKWEVREFRLISGMRVAAALGLAVTGIGVYLGNGWIAVVGLFAWALTFPIGTPFYWAGAATSNISWAWLVWRANKQPVPASVLDLASKAGVKPPKTMKVIPTNKINAGVSGSVLYVTKGFVPFIETPAGHGILGHEVAHLSKGNRRILVTGCFVMAVCTVAITALYNSPSALFYLAVMLTVGAPILQHTSWRAEHDADTTGPALLVQNRSWRHFGC